MRIDELYAFANDAETDILDRLRIKAGDLWECKAKPDNLPAYRDECGAYNVAEESECSECGASK